jgi:hypothetical protein
VTVARATKAAKVLVLAVVAAGVPATAWAEAAPPTATTAVVGGRIMFRDAARTATPAEAERLRWGHLSLELRHGWEVFTARPDASGVFTIAGPPGRYQLEYVRVGELAEFFVPQEVEARPGQVTCLGTLEVQVQDLTHDLGNNTSSDLHVLDDCATIGPDLQRASGATASVKTSLARPAPRATKHLSVVDVLVGFRAEGDAASGGFSSLRGNLVLPLGKESDWLVAASVIHVSAAFVNSRWPLPAAGGAPATDAWGGSAGAGYRVLSAVEGMVYGGYLGNTGRGGHGPLGGASLRIGTFLFGIGGRIEAYGTGERVGSLTLDVSPVGLLGALL